MQLVDTHVHINFHHFEGELDQLRHRWQTAGVVCLVHSCVEPREFAAIRDLADRLPELSFSVGLHPLEAHQWNAQMKVELASLVSSDPRVVAMGEMGLDFYKADDTQQQEQALLEQLMIAYDLGKPVIIHCRDAAARLRLLLEQFWDIHGPVPGVMHCWGGNPTETQWFLDLGFYISFSGIVTFKNAQSVQASAQMVPSDRLLIETDCPFLAPTPKRGQRNEPAYVHYVAEQIAKLRNIALPTLADQTTRNACQLFGLSLETA